MEAALVAAAERNDADAVERIQRAARGDDDALCDAVAAHLRTELEREAPPPPLDNTNDFPALPTTKKKRVPFLCWFHFRKQLPTKYSVM